MQTYRKLRALLLLAREINRKLGQQIVQSAQSDLTESRIPDDLKAMIKPDGIVAEIEDLVVLRPQPHGVFDCVLLESWCCHMLTACLLSDDPSAWIELKLHHDD